MPHKDNFHVLKDANVVTTTTATNTTTDDDSSSLGGRLEKNDLLKYFYEPSEKTQRLKENTLQRFPSNPKLRFSMDDDRSFQGVLGRAKAANFGRHETHSRRLSWMSAPTLDLSEPLHNLINLNEVIGEKFKVLLKPPKFDRDDILFSIHTFMSSIIDYIPSVKLDKTYQIFKDIRTLLKSPECIRLYGLLIHYCYWNIIHPAARNAIKDVKLTNKKRTSFMDVDVNDITAHTNNRLGLLPEVLAEENINYDAEVIQEKKGSYSFAVASPTHAHNMGDIQHALRVARSIVQIDDMFNQHVEENGVDDGIQIENSDPFQFPNLDEHQEHHEGKDANNGENINDDASVLTSQTGGSIQHMDEKTTNIPFASKPTLSIMTAPDDLSNHSRQQSQGPLPPINNNSPNQNAEGNSITGEYSQASLTSEASLSHHEKEKLFIQLETCVTSLFKQMGRGRFALVTGRQALITCCHYIVDDILTAMYPWFAVVTEDLNASTSPSKKRSSLTEEKEDPFRKSLKDLNLRLRRLVHQSISDLIDPSRIYTSAMILNLVLGLGSSKNIKEATRKAKQLLENESNGGGRKGKYFRTSTAVLALFGDTDSYLARKFLQRTGTLYTKVPGAVDPFLTKLDKVTEWDDPMEYFNSLEKEQEKEFQEQVKSSITDSEISQQQIKELTKFILTTGADPSSAPTKSPGKPLTENMSRPHSQRASSAASNKDGHIPDEPKRKPIDFLNLFKNQPDADFFPMGKNKNLLHSTENVNSHTLESMTSPLQTPLKPRSRISSPFSSSFLNSPHKNSSTNVFDHPISPSKRNLSLSLGARNYFSQKKSNDDSSFNFQSEPVHNTTQSQSQIPQLQQLQHRRPSIRFLSPLETVLQEKLKQKTEMENNQLAEKHNPRFYHRKPRKNIQQTRPSLYFQHLTKDHNNLTNHGGIPRLSSASAVGFLMNEESLTLQSSSVESDSVVSLAHNDYAEVPISLNAKAALMTLLVEKTTKIYKNQIPTNQSAQRIALLEGGDISFTSHAPKRRKPKK